jgi:mRNA interferase RelE/StbE
VPGKDDRLSVTRSARKELVGLPTKIGDQVERTIERLLARLRDGQRPQDMKGLEGRADTYRIDSGEYRVLFELDEAAAVVRVIRVRHRRDVYRTL